MAGCLSHGGLATSRRLARRRHECNRRRRQRALGKLTPIDFELAFTPKPAMIRSHNYGQPNPRQTHLSPSRRAWVALTAVSGPLAVRTPLATPDQRSPRLVGSHRDSAALVDDDDHVRGLVHECDGMIDRACGS